MNHFSIPTPCHEDFSKMSSTERGAFCQKCSTDVYDFSRRPLEEVKQILASEIGKQMCGKFSNVQLAVLNKGYSEWENRNLKSWQSKFTFALIIAFGLSLFSCSQEDESTLEEFRFSKIALIDEQHTPVSELGQLVQNNHAEQVFLLAPEIIEFDEIYDVVGLLEMNTYPEVVIEEHVICVTAGVYSTTTEFRDYLFQTTTINVPDTNSLLPEPILASSEFTTKAFPNPTSGPVTIQLNVEQAAQFDIQLYNLSGQLLSVVHSGELLEGEQRFNLDLNNYERGTYLIRIVSKDQQETLKVLKM